MSGIKKKRTKKAVSGCDDPSDRKMLTSYSAIVKHYKRNFSRLSRDELNHYASIVSYDEMLECVAYAKDPRGKRHPHQRRLKRAALNKVHKRLRQYDFESCESFEELFAALQEAIGDIEGIGELMLYDTANRLGSYLNLRPNRIHLHAGTRAGAHYLGLGHGQEFIDVSDLPRAFHSLNADQAEDCLCIYKDSLKMIRDLR